MKKKKEGKYKKIISSSFHITLILVALTCMTWEVSLYAKDRLSALTELRIGEVESQILIERSTLLNQKYRELERKELVYAKNNE